eukprot:gene7214-4486_t
MDDPPEGAASDADGDGDGDGGGRGGIGWSLSADTSRQSCVTWETPRHRRVTLTFTRERTGRGVIRWDATPQQGEPAANDDAIGPAPPQRDSDAPSRPPPTHLSPGWAVPNTVGWDAPPRGGGGGSGGGGGDGAEAAPPAAPRHTGTAYRIGRSTVTSIQLPRDDQPDGDAPPCGSAEDPIRCIWLPERRAQYDLVISQVQHAAAEYEIPVPPATTDANTVTLRVSPQTIPPLDGQHPCVEAGALQAHTGAGTNTITVVDVHEHLRRALAAHPDSAAIEVRLSVPRIACFSTATIAAATAATLSIATIMAQAKVHAPPLPALHVVMQHAIQHESVVPRDHWYRNDWLARLLRTDTAAAGQVLDSTEVGEVGEELDLDARPQPPTSCRGLELLCDASREHNSVILVDTNGVTHTIHALPGDDDLRTA